MDDRTLLELAARAYWRQGLADEEVSLRYSECGDGMLYLHADNQDHNGQDREFLWNPLTDDGDALRLAVKLQMELNIGADGMTKAYADGAIQGHGEDFGDPCAATRRAIVRAAAQIALDRATVSAPGAVEGEKT